MTTTLAYLRSFRLFNVALFDLISAMIGMILMFVYARNAYFPSLPMRNFVIAAVLLTIPIGIVFHVLFGTNTTISFNLGLSYQP